jgi:hypothetical protein
VLAELWAGARLGLAALVVLPMRLAVIGALWLVLSLLGAVVLALDTLCCGCRYCVTQVRTSGGGGGGVACRCRAAGAEQLRRSLPKTMFLWLARPLLRLGLFVGGFYWVRDCALPGYAYDARACVVANQGGPVELLYFLARFQGTVVVDMEPLPCLLVPLLLALGVLDSWGVEQLEMFESDGLGSDGELGGGGVALASSALAQYQALMALHNETHAGMHFGLPRLCLHMHGAGRRKSHTTARSVRRLGSFRRAQSEAKAEVS